MILQFGLFGIKKNVIISISLQKLYLILGIMPIKCTKEELPDRVPMEKEYMEYDRRRELSCWLL